MNGCRIRKSRSLGVVLALVLLFSATAAFAALPPGGTFTDDDGNMFEGAIEAIAAEGITKGCNPPANTRYCPNDFVTRGEMAVFLVRAFGYADDGGGNLFVDDDGLFYENAADRLKVAGVTLGCNPPSNNRYCGESSVTRGQMAAFLVRALGLSDDGGGNLYIDDDDSLFEAAIDKFGTAGITKGCNPPTNNRFCPNDFVTRGQMAAFLTRALTGEGKVKLMVNAETRFDSYTESLTERQQAAMRDLYETMVVWSPYFDSRLSWFPDGIAYIDLYAIYTDTDKDTRSIDHPEWILKDAEGNWLFIKWGCGGGTCPQWAADVGNPAFAADFVARVGDLLSRGYAGVMIDDVNLLWRISNGFGDTIPVDPRTGLGMTLPDWQQYVVKLVEKVRSTYPGADIMHNAIWYADAPGFSSSLVRRQTKAADWIMLERGANDSGLKGGDGKFSLETFMRFADMAHEVGSQVVFLDEDADSLAEQEYNLGVYLLVNDGDDLVSTEDYPLIAVDSMWIGFRADLGGAINSRYRWSGVWRRDFSGGVVLVGEPGIEGTTVALATPHRTLSGDLVNSVTLDSRSAVVLLTP